MYFLLQTCMVAAVTAAVAAVAVVATAQSEEEVAPQDIQVMAAVASALYALEAPRPLQVLVGVAVVATTGVTIPRLEEEALAYLDKAHPARPASEVQLLPVVALAAAAAYKAVQALAVVALAALTVAEVVQALGQALAAADTVEVARFVLFGPDLVNLFDNFLVHAWELLSNKYKITLRI